MRMNVITKSGASVVEICILMGYYAVSICNSLLKFRYIPAVPVQGSRYPARRLSSWISWTFKMGLISWPEMSVRIGCVIFQKDADLIFFEAEAWNHANFSICIFANYYWGDKIEKSEMDGARFTLGRWENFVFHIKGRAYFEDVWRHGVAFCIIHTVNILTINISISKYT